MALITLYIDEKHFEATIMVALTSMLVMYTLFQSISNDMPNTAYLKFLDYWLILGLVMPFVIFMTEVGLELGRLQKVKDMYGREEARYSREKCKYFAQVGLPIICFVFFVGYLAMAFQLHYYQ